MSSPQGPPQRQLPPEIYRRRRFAAIGAAFVLLVIVVVIVAVSCGGGSGDPQAAVSAEAAVSEGAAASAEAAVSEGVQTASPEAPTTRGEPDAAGAADAAATAEPAPVVQPGGQCPDAVIAVSIEPEKSNYDSGDAVTFFTTVTNTADVPCTRDLSGGQIVNTVAAVGGGQVWSNADCYPGTGSDIRTLEPGDKAQFKMTWAGTYSSQGCEPANRTPVPAGVYAVTAHVGTKDSAPTPFNIH